MNIIIDTENAAFVDDKMAEVKRILNTIESSDQILRDINGNTVGKVSTIPDAEFDLQNLLRRIIGNRATDIDETEKNSFNKYCDNLYKKYNI